MQRKAQKSASGLVCPSGRTRAHTRAPPPEHPCKPKARAYSRRVYAALRLLARRQRRHRPTACARCTVPSSTCLRMCALSRVCSWCVIMCAQMTSVCSCMILHLHPLHSWPLVCCACVCAINVCSRVCVCVCVCVLCQCVMLHFLSDCIDVAG
jgi:hypothetical protein